MSNNSTGSARVAFVIVAIVVVAVIIGFALTQTPVGRGPDVLPWG